MDLTFGYNAKTSRCQKNRHREKSQNKKYLDNFNSYKPEIWKTHLRPRLQAAFAMCGDVGNQNQNQDLF